MQPLVTQHPGRVRPRVEVRSVANQPFSVPHTTWQNQAAPSPTIVFKTVLPVLLGKEKNKKATRYGEPLQASWCLSLHHQWHF